MASTFKYKSYFLHLSPLMLQHSAVTSVWGKRALFWLCSKGGKRSTIETQTVSAFYSNSVFLCTSKFTALKMLCKRYDSDAGIWHPSYMKCGVNKKVINICTCFYFNLNLNDSFKMEFIFFWRDIWVNYSQIVRKVIKNSSLE